MNNLESLSSEIEERINNILDRLDILVKRNEELENKLNRALAKNIENEEVIDSMREKHKALKIASAITGSDNDSIKETKTEINSLIRELDYCISQLSE